MALLPVILPVTLMVSSSATAQVELGLDELLNRPRLLQQRLPKMGWIPGTSTLWMVAPGVQDAALTRKVDEKRWTPRFDAAELHAALLAAGAKGTGPRFGPMQWVDAATVRVEQPGGIYHWKIGADRAERVLATPHARRAKRSIVACGPGDRIAAFRGIRLRGAVHDLFIARAGKAPLRLTEDGSELVSYGGIVHQGEFGIEDGMWWDRAGRRLAFYREDLRPVAPYPVTDWTTDPPGVRSIRYSVAGAKNSVVAVGVYDSAAAANPVCYLESDPGQDLYWTNVTFSPDGAHVLVALVTRGQDRMDLVRFDAATGKRGAVLLSEHDAEWVEPRQGPIFLPDDSGRFLWFSARSGFRHLYLYDGAGKLVRPVTEGEFDVQEYHGMLGSRALVMASGENPLEMHLWSADTGSGEMKRLTSARGCHRVVLSDDRAWALSTHSNLYDPGSIDLISIDGGETTMLNKATNPLQSLRTGGRRFFAVEADGATLHGLLLVPPGAEPARRGKGKKGKKGKMAGGKKHPVLHFVYGGPHFQMVRDTWLGGVPPWLYYMASRGFVVFVLDSRGSANRGIEFEQAIFRELGTVEVRDQLAGLEHVCKLPFADRTRVGVHGWSYGGFLTLSLMTKAPGRYACGVGGAPVTDWTRLKSGYAERYMDTPAENPRGYKRANLVSRAANLDGRLMVVHGTDDEKVPLAHAMRFHNAGIEAGKLVELVPYPKGRHELQPARRAHFLRMMIRFFEEQLRP